MCRPSGVVPFCLLGHFSSPSLTLPSTLSAWCPSRDVLCPARVRRVVVRSSMCRACRVCGLCVCRSRGRGDGVCCGRGWPGDVVAWCVVCVGRVCGVWVCGMCGPCCWCGWCVRACCVVVWWWVGCVLCIWTYVYWFDVCICIGFVLAPAYT